MPYIPAKLDTHVQKITLCRILVAARQPNRAEWYFNSIRHRARLTALENRSLGIGTCRNEALHQNLNAHYKSTIQITARMLDAQLQTWLAAEMAVFVKATEANTTINMRREDMRSMVCARIDLFSNEAWTRHLAAPSTVWSSKKPTQQDVRKHRGGLVKDQEVICNTTEEKTITRKMTTVYN